MFDRTFEPDPRSAPADPSRDRMRDGHRREYDAREDRESLSSRERRPARRNVSIAQIVQSVIERGV